MLLRRGLSARGACGKRSGRVELTLRLTLAIFGLVVCAALAIWAVMVDARGAWVALLVLLAVVAVIDVAVILRRKRRREPG